MVIFLKIEEKNNEFLVINCFEVKNVIFEYNEFIFIILVVLFVLYCDFFFGRNNIV